MKSTASNYIVRMTALALAAALSACGGGGSDSPNTTASTQTDTLLKVAPPSVYALGSKEKGAFEQLNEVRIQGGFGALTQNTKLDIASANHANYLVSNYYTQFWPEGNHFIWNNRLYEINPTTKNMNAHSENTGDVGFTGAKNSDRNKYTGADLNASEVIAFGSTLINPNTNLNCTYTLLATVFHRSGMLSTGDNQFGIGFTRTSDGNDAACIIQTGYKEKSTAPANWVGVYPADQQKNVAIGMAGEAPNPAPDIPDADKGMPATIYFGSDLVTVNSFTMTASGSSEPTPVRTLTSKEFPGYIKKNEVHILPLKNLKPLTVYTVNFSGTTNNGAVNKKWVFETK